MDIKEEDSKIHIESLSIVDDVQDKSLIVEKSIEEIVIHDESSSGNENIDDKMESSLNEVKHHDDEKDLLNETSNNNDIVIFKVESGKTPENYDGHIANAGRTPANFDEYVNIVF